MIPAEAVEAAKEAMREVTPPPGVSKADWLAEHGDFALIAGAIAAAEPYMLREAKADAWDECEAAQYEIKLNAAGNAWEPIKDNPYRSKA